MKKYDTEFWQTVLAEYTQSKSDWRLCGGSKSFANEWHLLTQIHRDFCAKLCELATEWPERPQGTKVGVTYLFFGTHYSWQSERQIRIDFLNYLINNKIEFEV